MSPKLDFPESSFLKKLFFPLKPKLFLSPSLDDLSDLPLPNELGLSPKLDLFLSLNFLFLLYGAFPLLFLLEFFLISLGAALKFGSINLLIEFHIDLSSGVRKVNAEPSEPALAVLPIRCT